MPKKCRPEAKNTISLETTNWILIDSFRLTVVSSSDKKEEVDLRPNADLDFLKTGSGKVNELRALLGDPTKKLTLEMLEEAEKNRVRNDRAEDLLYHVGLVELLARCSLGKQHMPEALSQSIISPEDCYNVIMNPHADIMVKAAYTRFMAEVWLYTARTTELWSEVSWLQIFESNLDWKF